MTGRERKAAVVVGFPIVTRRSTSSHLHLLGCAKYRREPPSLRQSRTSYAWRNRRNFNIVAAAVLDGRKVRIRSGENAPQYRPWRSTTSDSESGHLLSDSGLLTNLADANGIKPGPCRDPLEFDRKPRNHIGGRASLKPLGSEALQALVTDLAALGAGHPPMRHTAGVEKFLSQIKLLTGGLRFLPSAILSNEPEARALAEPPPAVRTGAPV